MTLDVLVDEVDQDDLNALNPLMQTLDADDLVNFADAS